MEKRSAGILMHISSLPSAFGIGDMGPAAMQFVDFLYRSNQSVWQMLPLNPTSSQQGHSPYSSTSSMAGNTLFISPELLIKNGFLSHDNIEEIQETVNNNGPDSVETFKKRMLQKVYDNYRLRENQSVKQCFQSFCSKEKYWLDDFALYTVIRNKQGNRPWYEWDTEFRERRVGTMSGFASEFNDELEEMKFAQMLFHQQWNELKAHCRQRNIHLLGDLPFYVGYDSADVWSHRDLFSLDKQGRPLKVAGVPPDAFNDNGQLWGMPVFRWDVMKEKNYDWWIMRLKKNLELFDEIRLDHFRAFSDYWEVDGNMDTALTGKWKPGPGTDFFNVVKKELGGLPFVAEDLGEIDDAVYKLRDEFNLPGMNVLQFAFGDNMPQSTYIPHHHHANSVVYTGTHDNNTTLGWYNSLNKQEKTNLSLYTGHKVNKKNVSDVLCRIAYGSVAQRAILPMQDVLGLDEEARMNMPSSTEKNWMWRMHKNAIDDRIVAKLVQWCYLFDRKKEFSVNVNEGDPVT